jgi:hypothetical protein
VEEHFVALVLDDDSTYSGDGAVWILTAAGSEKLTEDNDAKNLDVGEHVTIKLSMTSFLMRTTPFTVPITNIELRGVDDAHP